LLLTVPAAIAYAATIVTYAQDVTMGPQEIRSTQTHLDRAWNRVYRPLGYEFRLQYMYTNGNTASWFNATSNPFVVNAGAGNAWANCRNDSTVFSMGATCQSTVP
jgi:hypothetical protein